MIPKRNWLVLIYARNKITLKYDQNTVSFISLSEIDPLDKI